MLYRGHADKQTAVQSVSQALPNFVVTNIIWGSSKPEISEDLGWEAHINWLV